MAASRAVEGVVSFEGSNISYRLTWKKVKNLNLRVKAGGLVELSAPAHVTQAEAEAFLLQKAPWVLRSLEKYDALTEKASSLEEGHFWYLGEPVALNAVFGQEKRIFLEGDVLTVETTRPENKAKVQRLAAQWLEGQSREILARAVEEASRLLWQYDLPPYTVKLRKMKARWGSCQPGTGLITLNDRLICVPYCCIVAVAAHELTHLLHPNHSPSFYAVLNSVMPLYPRHKETLACFAPVLR